MQRRHWLAHCSLLGCGLAFAGLLASPSTVQGAGAAPAILVVGDSLSAEYGLQRGSGWVALLEQRLAREKTDATVVNASISGDTTSGGRSRLPALLSRHRPTHLVLELGANDALRGLPLSMTRSNLAEMVRAGKAAGAQVLLVGMQMPPNYGRQYSEDFARMFREVAQAENAQLVPFLLKGVADGPNADALFQGDRIHPNEEAHPIMLDTVWSVLRPLLK